ncbi:AMP-binding protein [Rhodococcus sp. X156]|uniref:AMP-binding protein n=1 Tax=Rhodococcus sp. X156 TaxID=2499145 RepID=UPI001F49C793|nr:AMP-binding protein [Rhodococcus sp. X156]
MTAARGDAPSFTTVDYSTEADGTRTTLTFAELGVRVRAVAARLQQVAEPGARVAILAPQGMEYIVGFFAAVHAGLVAVPLFDPEEPGHSDRLHAVLGDCAPTVVLTSTSAAPGVRAFFKAVPAAQRPRTIAVDGVPDSLAQSWTAPELDRSSIAYLQYTSGSTRVPAGVEITHGGVLTNVMQMVTSFEVPPETGRGVSWLPLFHDMGLLVVIIPAMIGRPCAVMTPRAFVQRPLRWIKLLAEAPGVIAAAPDFAYEHAARRGRPPEGADLDLSGVVALINGSEPVRPSSLQQFQDAFGPYGLSPYAQRPSYGMAEATLFVAASTAGQPPRVSHFDRDQLGAGKAVEVAADAPAASMYVAVGDMSVEQESLIVDPQTCEALPDGSVGEIWLHGENIGAGYYNRAEETEQTFRALVAESTDGRHWLRTGDLGTVVDGQLYITGRAKDMIIIGGRNHYPQDVEFTATEASKVLRSGFVAAFSVPAADGATGSAEQLVVVAERASGQGKADPEPAIAAVRAALAQRHGLSVREVLLLPGGSIPRTSSGKIARRACRQQYLDGTLRGAPRPGAFPDVQDDTHETEETQVTA